MFGGVHDNAADKCIDVLNFVSADTQTIVRMRNHGAWHRRVEGF